MEREVYRQRGILIATDFLVNSGGVIFAAQERLIKTPANLRIPNEILGNRKAVDTWLVKNSAELGELAERRRAAAETYRNEVIRRNMHELIDLLVSEPESLPCEAAERISIHRITSSERDQTAGEIMAPMQTIQIDKSVREAAARLVEANSLILAVVSKEGDLVGVVTDWDITRATAMGSPDDQPLEKIMSHEVISASPTDSILEIVRKLEYHEVSALPVVEQGAVLGMVTTDMLARRSLLRLLQSGIDPTG